MVGPSNKFFICFLSWLSTSLILHRVHNLFKEKNAQEAIQDNMIYKCIAPLIMD